MKCDAITKKMTMRNIYDKNCPFKQDGHSKAKASLLARVFDENDF